MHTASRCQIPFAAVTSLVVAGLLAATAVQLEPQADAQSQFRS